MTAVDFRDGEWGQVMFFHDLMWVQFRRYCCLIVFFAFYKYRVFFWCIHEQVRGAETSKLDREILADIAGKTNQLGLRWAPTIWDDVQKTQLRMFKRHNSECSKHFPISETSYPTSPSQLELGQTLWKSRPSSRGAKRPGGDDKSKIFLKRQIKAWYSGRRCSSCSITFLINLSSSGAAHRTSTRQIFSTTWRQKGSKVFVRWNLLCDVHFVQTSYEVNFMVQMISREAWKAVFPDIARLWETCLPSQKSCGWCN